MNKTLYTLCIVISVSLSLRAQVFSDSFTSSSTPQPSASWIDSKVLKERWKNVRIIGIGEASHGTREFFEIRHALTSFLIQEMNVKFILVEASNLRMELLNQYIQGDSVSLDSALLAMQRWVLRTASFRENIIWLKHYNATRPTNQRTQIFGIDQDNYTASSLRLVEVLRHIQPTDTFADHIFDKLNLAQKISAFQRLKKMEKDEVEKLFSVFDEIENYLHQSIFAQLDVNHHKKWEEALYHLENLRAVWRYALASAKSSGKGYSLIRDREMARNVNWRMNRISVEEKVVIWAHNEHIERANMRMKGMGYYLDKDWGDLYYALGLEFKEGRCTVFDPSQQKLVTSYFDPPTTGIEHYLTNNAQEIQFLDLHHRDYQHLANHKIWIHDIPAIRIDKKYALEKIKPIKHFDGIVYVRTSHPSLILYMNK